MQHIGIYLQNQSNPKAIIHQILKENLLQSWIDTNNLQGAIFSSITINKLIEDEMKHDKFVVRSANNNSLQYMSSGQKRKALLQYLLTQKPDFLIIDDIFASIDPQTQTVLLKKLHNTAAHTHLIQLFYRKNDLLPYIQTVVLLDEKNHIKLTENREDFLQPDAGITQQSFQLPMNFLNSNAKPSNHPLVALKNLSISYNEKPVLNQINWQINAGEFWQLAGPIGAGKSSLLTMITGDNPKAYGQDITLFGMKKGSGESIWDIKKRIGYFTPSMLAQFKRNMSVENMIISGLMDSVGLYVQASDMQKRLAQNWMDILGTDFRGRSFQDLSLGQQRMVMLARAMIKQPPLLILDEPTVGLDDANAALFVAMVNAIAASKQIAIIYVSHRQESKLQPDFIFQLKPDKNGSIGEILNTIVE